MWADWIAYRPIGLRCCLGFWGLLVAALYIVYAVEDDDLARFPASFLETGEILHFIS
jgi:hypothetical protein